MNKVVEKILEAAIIEFAEKGYEAASTNKIKERAKVAKGLLFHYFKNKEKLYIESYKRVLKWSKEKFEEFALKNADEEFFLFLKKWSLNKITLAAQNPVYSRFLLTVTNLPLRLQSTVLDMIKANLLGSTGILYEKIKSVGLREGISHEDALKFIMSVFEGLGNLYLNQYRDKPEELLNNTEKILSDTDKFLDMIKFGLLPKKGS